jgi:hypothetical protein
MCFECLSYLLDRIRADDGDRRDDVGDIRLAARSGRRARGGCDCRNRRGMNGGRRGKAPRI